MYLYNGYILGAHTCYSYIYDLHKDYRVQGDPKKPGPMTMSSTSTISSPTAPYLVQMILSSCMIAPTNVRHVGLKAFDLSRFQFVLQICDICYVCVYLRVDPFGNISKI